MYMWECERKKHRTYILLSDGVISISVEPLHDVVRLPITFYVWKNSKKKEKRLTVDMLDHGYVDAKTIFQSLLRFLILTGNLKISS